MMRAQLHVILNPVSGGQQAESILSSAVDPLLKRQEPKIEYQIRRTARPGHASDITYDLLQSAERTDGLSLRIALLGGDGTTHEVLNGINRFHKARSQELPQIELAVVPTGTANALFAGLYPPHVQPASNGTTSCDTEHGWRLRSLKALLSSLCHSFPSSSPSAATSVPLTLAKASISSADETSAAKELVSHLVTSHAFHASILLDSDSADLRAKYPGVERFKVAAGMNATRWTNYPLASAILSTAETRSQQSGTVRLLPYQKDDHGGEVSVEKYDARSRSWRSESLQEPADHVQIEGPFFYFAALTTDRLEPAFVPGPFSAAKSTAAFRCPSQDEWQAIRCGLSRPSNALDVVIIRPARDPAVQAAIKSLKSLSSGPIDWSSPSEAFDIKQRFAAMRLSPIMAAMYDEGKHIQLTYPLPDDAAAELATDGQGEYVVEYYRTGGYIWLAGNEGEGEERARVACIDGAIVKGDRTEVRVVQNLTKHVRVWR
ncbi:hypothetical protein K437DRAFT_269715 [Tilletiaria anomala UBC 951]|uniref:DAGKc domain-containing protein n=1 Tax=Tilletiaria anomala (strain ATCC 24038 / CBS 436.72 / UBC 951) TaxID=1037660 RepID=A0A066VIK2_TILAU|nr:uncharacterized protein K437DRAFT_269715 [Tilletiaria anomala UBC 951]KDN41316.1 hypothetical protein K437DRAFT_269715 [Tilletiaria anomala UBC 951]